MRKKEEEQEDEEEEKQEEKQAEEKLERARGTLSVAGLKCMASASGGIPIIEVLLVFHRSWDQ